jgi:hypothetical protein
MTDDAPKLTKSEEGNPVFARTVFNPDYDERRAANLAFQDCALLEAYYVTQNQKLLGRSRILEFGCELTGGSYWLADVGPLSVTDITLKELITSAERLKRITPPANVVELHFLRHGKDIEVMAPCDLLYSTLSAKRTPLMVLTHIISLLLAKVTIGGVALLHVPTQHRNCSLMVEGTLELDDLCIIPQWKMSEILNQLGFEMVLIQENKCFRTSDIVYHTLLAQKIYG